ncbi:hypothetical protein GBAR_LOCUS8210 [Geodia barretti]|uniref:Uncharacterized protein n=1 Tax=Geodia barretti TaxID=519541 RepID=A0AA35WGN6_GEOBA|nr:hypothetical protein GBAR_LOCUS8210 [Geodia barretti]
MNEKYPEPTLRKIIRERGVLTCLVVDHCVFLGLVLALNKLAKAASIKPKKTGRLSSHPETLLQWP